MSKHVSSLTRNLSSSKYSLVVARKRSKLWLLPLAVVLVSGSVYALREERTSPDALLHQQIAELNRQNTKLSDDLKEQTLNFEHEEAVRKSLEKELADQGEELKKVRKDLSFFRNNSVRQDP
jgi:septal ring factor EnvC (AmiA/AmiB activator)